MSQPFFIVESWSMFPTERARLYAVLRDTNVRIFTILFNSCVKYRMCQVLG
jgi:hypothetical protein